MAVTARKKGPDSGALLQRVAEELESRFPEVKIDWEETSLLPDEGMEIINAYNVPQRRHFEFMDAASVQSNDLYAEHGIAVCIIPHSVAATRRHYSYELTRLLTRRTRHSELSASAVMADSRRVRAEA